MKNSKSDRISTRPKVNHLKTNARAIEDLEILGNEAKDFEEITRILNQISDEKDSSEARNQLFSVMYKLLYAKAGRLMQNQVACHTLQPSALVNEVFLKLANSASSWKNRKHFMGCAVSAMRCILVDHAKSKLRAKRTKPCAPVPLDSVLLLFTETPEQFIDLEEALVELGANGKDLLPIIELRYFGGLTLDQISEMLDLSPKQVRNRWEFARKWLRNRLK